MPCKIHHMQLLHSFCRFTHAVTLHEEYADTVISTYQFRHISGSTLLIYYKPETIWVMINYSMQELYCEAILC